MKTKKFALLSTLLTITFTLYTFCIVTSCNGDDEESDAGNGQSVSGIYKADNGDYKGVSFIMVYNFINSNTVIDYSTVANSQYGWASGATLAQIPGHPGWYYAQQSAKQYTYYVVNNKIILSNGKILTKNGSNLTVDGSGTVYSKW